MADSFIQLSPDSTGKRVDTRTAPDGDHREVNVIGSPTTADVAEVDSANGVDVDVTRVIPGTSATHLGKAVDSVPGATDTGVAALVVRDDALAALTPADGDYTHLRTDSTGALWVRDTGGAAGGTAMVDDAAFTPATTQGTPAFGFADETAPDSVDEGDAGALRMTLDRKLLTRVVGASDANRLDVDGSGHAQVDIAAASVTVPVSNADMTAAAASLAIMDDWDETDRAKVNPIVGQAGVAAGAGAVGATVQRVTLASDDPAVAALQILDNAIAGSEMQVDIVSGSVGITGAVDTELPAAAALADNTANPTAPAVGAFGQVWDGATWDRTPGNSADGSLVNLGANNDVSLNAGTNNIGDVDVLTVPAPLNLVGGGVEAAALRVTLANDSTGLVSVDDNGGSLTVDGTVAVTNADMAAAAASLAIMDDWDETDRAKVNPIAGQAGVQGASGTVTALTQRVVLATDVGLPAGTANIGDVDVLTMPVTEVVGDVAADAAVPANPLAIGGRASTAVPTAVSADGDSVYNWLNRLGMAVVSAIPGLGLNADPHTLLSETAQYTTTQTSAVLVAGGASERIIVTSIQIQAGGTTAGTLQVYFGTGAYARGTDEAIFDGEFAPSATLKPGVVMSPPAGFRAGALGDDILVTTSAAINPLTITVWYYILGV